MATLVPTLTLTSSDLTSDSLSLTVTDSLTVTNPFIGPSKKACNVNGGAKVDLDATGSANKYVFVKHSGYQSDGSTATTNKLEVHIHDGSAARDIMRLEAGEFAYFPLLAAAKVQVVSGSSQTILVEYAFYTKG